MNVPHCAYYTPTFALSAAPVDLESYNIQPETFCSAYIRTEFNCNIRDGFTFVAPDSGVLVDVPSDDPAFDPTTTQVYYNILVDAGVNPLGPDYRATFAYQGTFLFPPPLSAANYDCSYFVVSSFSSNTEPCPDFQPPDTSMFMENYFYDTIQASSKTQADPRIFDDVEKKTLYETKFQTFGDFYFRNSSSSIIAPASAALSGVLIKYPTEISNEIANKLINFDIYYDILQFETENYLIFDKIEFNYNTEQIKGSSTNELYIKRGNHKKIEKISTVWFNEKENELIFAKTNLYLDTALSASNFKIIYPTIYAMSLDKMRIVQLYPNITFETAIGEFSPIPANFNVEIVSVDKPIMSYSSESGIYSIVYVTRDTSDLFYINVVTFRYLNGVLSNIRNIVYKPNMNTVHNNFNDISFGRSLDFNTFTVQGSSAGSIIGGEFTFGS